MAQTEQISILASEDCKLNDSVKLRFGTGSSENSPTTGDVYMQWDGTDFDIVPEVTGSTLNIGAASYAWTILMLGNTTLKFGTLSSTTPGSGVTLSDSVTKVLDVHADDNNTALSTATLARAIAGRYMVYANCSNENWGIDGLLKWSGVAHTGNVNAGVVGRFESTGTCTMSTGAGNTYAAGVMGRVGGGGTFTINSGTWVSGVLAFYNTTTANAFTGAFTTGFHVAATDIASSGKWDYGVYVEADGATRGIHVGALGSNTTSGLPIGGATAINGFYCDDSGAAQTASTVWRNLDARTYFSVTQSNTAADFYSIRGQIKAASGINFTGDTSQRACVFGYLELAGATTVGAGSFLSAVEGEIWADGNLTATGKVAGVMSRCYTSGSATLGNFAAAFMATKQWASTDSWPCAIYIDAADYVFYWPTGTNYEGGVKITAISNVSTSASGAMKVRVGGTDYYIPLWAAAQLDGE